MIFINCPNCGSKLMEGEGGSSVRIKCAKCGKLTNVKLERDKITLIPTEPYKEKNHNI